MGYHDRMSQLSLLIQNYGVFLVFGTVLLEQFGLPIPAFPVLVLAGAMAFEGGASWQVSLLAVLLACLICDYFWFSAGRYLRQARAAPAVPDFPVARFLRQPDRRPLPPLRPEVAAGLQIRSRL